jgi:hypothetical protein
MLRAIVLLLLLANLGFYAWTQGQLDGVVGVRAQGDREPERLARQVRADSVHILPAGATSAPAGSPGEPALACLEAGPYTPAQIASAESALQGALPPGSWSSVRNELPAVWMVYMGKYPNREGLQKKEDELKRMKVPYEELRNAPEFEVGLSLGRFDNKDTADKALAELTQRGVRTARVAQLSAPGVSHTLRIPRADDALWAQVMALKSDALLGRPFGSCAR